MSAKLRELMLTHVCYVETQTHRRFRSLNIFGEHKTTERTEVLSYSDVYSASPPGPAQLVATRSSPKSVKTAAGQHHASRRPQTTQDGSHIALRCGTEIERTRGPLKVRTTSADNFENN
jgi:hypothetical protein